jgi:SAM-dependent methyltransferase
MKKWLMKLSKKRSRQGLYEFLIKQYSVIPKGSKVLSIGSGGEVNRLLNQYASSNDFNVISFDFDSQRRPDILGDICVYDFKDEKFDFVIIAEVLEHLYAPHLGIENIYKVLKDNGVLILTTPFILPIHEGPYDYYRFTKYGLQYLLRNFQDVKISERNSYFEAIDVLWVRMLQVNTERTYFASKIIIPCVYFLKRPLTNLLSKLILTDAMTTGYVVTARKNPY